MVTTITIDCAFETLSLEGIIPRELRRKSTFGAYVSQIYNVKDMFGLVSMDLDSYFRLHRKFDPNTEENGRRSRQNWAGPKVAQGYNREDPRPRVDRRAYITTGWEVVNLAAYANYPFEWYKSPLNQNRQPQRQTSYIGSQQQPRLPSAKDFKFLRGKEQYWDYLNMGSGSN